MLLGMRSSEKLEAGLTFLLMTLSVRVRTGHPAPQWAWEAFVHLIALPSFVVSGATGYRDGFPTCFNRMFYVGNNQIYFALCLPPACC